MISNSISFMILLPFVGSIALALLPAQANGKFNYSRLIALLSSLIASIYGLFLVFSLQGGVGMTEIREVVPWLEAYSISYDVAVTGLNALAVVLVAVVFPLILLFEFSRNTSRSGVYGFFLLLQSALFGLVCAQDLFLLFFFWALTTLPFYFLIIIWGRDDREKAAFRYIISASIGNALFFTSLVFVYYAAEPHTFSIDQLMSAGIGTKTIDLFGFSVPVSLSAFTLFCLGLLFRIPCFLFHGWFSYISRQAPATVLVAFCGVFVPVGMYVFAKVAFSLFPHEMANYSTVLIVIASFSIVFGALCAVSQRDLSLILAYLSITQVGLMLLGLSSLDQAGVVGAFYQQLSTGLGLAGFGLFCGLVYERGNGNAPFSGIYSAQFGGLVSQAPMLALVAGILVSSILGLPGIGNFVGQSLVIMGGYSVHPFIVGIIVIGILLMTYGLFSVYRQIFLGKPDQPLASFQDLNILEKSYFIPLIVTLLIIGTVPKIFIDLMRPSVLTLLSVVKS